MACYHCEIKIGSRANGKSACAAAAYRACARVVDERTGVVHDYTRKHGLVAEGVVTPEDAPESWSDRGTLWNAVEAGERAKNAQLFREFELALPHELGREGQIALTIEFARARAAEGMCVDWAIHDPSPAGHNVHAHVMCTMRPCDASGFLPKSHTEYIVRDSLGNESQMDARTLKASTAAGGPWEKVYTWRRGSERRQLTAAEAASWDGCKRVGKDPVKVKVCAVDWNDQGNAERWRAEWADLQNAALEAAGSDARVDHRSLARQGIDRIPTAHEGPAVTAIERAAERAARDAGLVPAPVVPGDLGDEEALDALLAIVSGSGEGEPGYVADHRGPEPIAATDGSRVEPTAAPEVTSAAPSPAPTPKAPAPGTWRGHVTERRRQNRAIRAANRAIERITCAAGEAVRALVRAASDAARKAAPWLHRALTPRQREDMEANKAELARQRARLRMPNTNPFAPFSRHPSQGQAPRMTPAEAMAQIEAVERAPRTSVDRTSVEPKQDVTRKPDVDLGSNPKAERARGPRR